MTVELHSENAVGPGCLTVEITDPHTGALLALYLDPTITDDHPIARAQRAHNESMRLLADVLQPD